MSEDTQRGEAVDQVDWPDDAATLPASKQLWICDDCAVIVPVFSSDPPYPDAVFCPDCHTEMDMGAAKDVQ